MGSFRRAAQSCRSVSWVYCCMGLVVSLLLATVAHAQLNPIQLENLNQGTTDWRIPYDNLARSREIEGYASETSVNKGGSISFYVSVATGGTRYNFDFYRMGCYPDAAGNCLGGRLMDPGTPHHDLTGFNRGTPTADPYTGLIECNWEVSLAIQQIPNDWVSGVYLAKLSTVPPQGQTTSYQSYIIFVVRDETRTADYLFQSAVTTYQAYNNWGGKSLYNHNSDIDPILLERVRAYRVSFNRPYTGDFSEFGAGSGTAGSGSGGAGAGDFFRWEVHMLRWLEKKGFDVTYGTNVDIHDSRVAPLLLSRVRGFLSVGHDEYWSTPMRDHIEAARDNRAPINNPRGPVGLGFFSGNSVYWRIRLEPSSPPASVPNRTIFAYKYDVGNPGPPPRGDERGADDPLRCYNPDPRNPDCTYEWILTPRPDYQLTGVTSAPAFADSSIIAVKSSDPGVAWFYSGTSLQAAPPDSTLFLPGLLGYEADQMCPTSDPRFPCTYPPPAGLVMVGNSPFQESQRPPPPNSLCPPNGAAFCWSNMTLYTGQGSPPAWVFSTGSIQWSWGLTTELNRFSLEAQKMTCNVLEKFTGTTDPSRCPAVVPLQTYSLTATPTSVAAGASVSVAWTAPPGRPATDWIGLYPAGAPSTAYLARYYTGGAASGSVPFRMPTRAGVYEVRYFIADRFLEAGRRAQITVR